MSRVIPFAQQYGLAFVAALIALLITRAVEPVASRSPFLPFVAAVCFSAWYGGVGPGIFTAGLTVLAHLYFIYPNPIRAVSDPAYVIPLLVFGIVALLVTWLTAGLRRESQIAQHQAALIDLSLDAIITRRLDGTIAFWSQGAKSLYGWAPEEALGKRINDLLQTQFPEGEEVIQARLAREGRWSGDLVHKRRDGSQITVLSRWLLQRGTRGELPSLLETNSDITERKAIEQERETARAAAERAEQRSAVLAAVSAELARSLDYSTTLHSVADAVIPVFADYCMVYALEGQELTRVAEARANPAHEQLSQELTRLVQSDLSDPDNPVGRALRTGKSIVIPDLLHSTVEAVVSDEEARRILLELGLRSMLVVPLNARGQTTGAIVFGFTDSGRRYDQSDVAFAEEISNRAVVAIENARLYEEAREAILIRDRFIAMASHELKTPLTSIKGYAELLVDRVSPDREASELRMLRVVRDQTERLEKMVTMLLDLSRLEQGTIAIERAPVDLSALVERIVGDFRPVLSHHSLELVNAAGRIVIQGDELRLEQVLQNLLQNAIKYSPLGGPIVVSLSGDDEWARVHVTDCGIGIPANELAGLFARFYRAGNADRYHISGLGIGLFLARETVRQHGGDITVESREGEGCTFTVTLPLQQHVQA